MVKHSGRTLVVGNISGGLKAFRECLLASRYSQSKDRLIFLGNYVGELPENPETIEALIWLKETAAFKPIFLRGSSDKWTELWLNSSRASPYWLINGGTNVVKSYIRSEHLTKDRHRQFFNNLEDYYIDFNNRAFVNAGYENSKGLGHEEIKSRYYYHKGLWKESISNPRKYEVTNRGGVREFRSYIYEEIFISHLPTTDYIYNSYTPELPLHDKKEGDPITVPMNRRNIWNLNTGAEHGEPLTIMDIDTKQFWQSRPTRYIYQQKQVA